MYLFRWLGCLSATNCMRHVIGKSWIEMVTESETQAEQTITGNYSGPYRPQVHFSPPKGYMNDPNGLHVDQDGVWHLYYQYYPEKPTPGPQHWGHATSSDLYHWVNQPIALYPPDNKTTVFSGSAVTDPNNTSGFFPAQTDGVVAIYTLNSPGSEVQAIAYSCDGGYTFTPYAQNPVLDVNSANFRDPKVIWYQDHWVMVIAFAEELVVGIYTSYDLIYWEHSSNVTHAGLLKFHYECPNLISIPVRENGTTTGESVWVMFISGGQVSQYLPGNFDGWTFTPFDAGSRLADFASDNYAGQWFYGTPESESVSIAWAQFGGRYASVVPTGREGWRSAMTLPRRNYLTKLEVTGWDLVSVPYDLTPVRGASLYKSDQFANKSAKIDYANSTGALYFQANFTFPSSGGHFSSSSGLNFTFSSVQSEENVSGGYYFAGLNPNNGWLDRGNTKAYGPDDPLYPTLFSTSQTSRPNTILGVIDRSILELFINDGESSGTMVFYADEPLTELHIVTGGLPEASTVCLDVWELSSVWPA